MNTDYRAVLDAFSYFDNPEYETDEAWEICLSILYKDYDVDKEIPASVKQELFNFAKTFLEAGVNSTEQDNRVRLMDWEQDAPLIAAAISAMLGRDVRDPTPMHWWTLVSYYLNIKESLYGDIIYIRSKKAKGKKLEKNEQEFYKANKALIDLKHKGREERSEEEKEALRELLGIRPKQHGKE